jgi:hypothetical protein
LAGKSTDEWREKTCMVKKFKKGKILNLGKRLKVKIFRRIR